MSKIFLQDYVKLDFDAVLPNGVSRVLLQSAHMRWPTSERMNSNGCCGSKRDRGTKARESERKRNLAVSKLLAARWRMHARARLCTGQRGVCIARFIPLSGLSDSSKGLLRHSLCASRSRCFLDERSCETCFDPSLSQFLSTHRSLAETPR